jgi:membrane protease YdiL (CAAX protease family)
MCGALPAAILLGVLWALWHLPLFLVDGWTSSPLTVYVLILTGLSVLMAFSYNLSGGSVLVAVIAHSAGNSCSHMLRGVLKGAESRESPSGDLIIALSLLGLAGIIAAATKGRLAVSKLAKSRQGLLNPIKTD